MHNTEKYAIRMHDWKYVKECDRDMTLFHIICDDHSVVACCRRYSIVKRGKGQELVDILIPIIRFINLRAMTDTKPSSLRVRIINSDSGLSKDLLVEIRVGYTLFDAIYNTDAVKKANVRKWNSGVTQNVKSGTHEIKCSVGVMQQEDGTGDDSKSVHTYSITDMKQTSTKQLYSMLGGSKLGDTVVTMRLHCAEKKKSKAFDHSKLLSGDGGAEGKMMRCPFSGMEFDEDALKDFIKHQNTSST